MTEELEQLRAESDSWMKEAEKVAAGNIFQANIYMLPEPIFQNMW